MDCAGLDRLLVLLRSPPLRHVDLEAGGDGGVPQAAVPSHTVRLCCPAATSLPL